MPLYLTIILYTIFTLMFVYYSKHQFADDRGESQGNWHIWRFLMAFYFCLMNLISAFYPPAWQDWLIASFIQAPIFDVGINVIALINVKPFYSGSTAQWDGLKAKKWLFYGIGLILVIIVKIFVKFTNQDIITWISQL